MFCFRPISPKAPPLPPGMGLLREPHMEEEEHDVSAKSKDGKKSPAVRKTPTRKTPTHTSPKTSPAPKTPPPGKATAPQRKTPTPKGQRTPTLQAFGDKTNNDEKGKQTNEERQSPGRVSRGSKGSRGRISQGSKKTSSDIDVEDETRPFSQAHEEPLTQVEIETDEENDKPGITTKQSEQVTH